MINLLNLSPLMLVELFKSYGEPPFRAVQLIKWVHQLGVTDFAQMSNFSRKLREQLSQHCSIELPRLSHEALATDGTRKWLWAMGDGALIETVYIPDGNRGTLCVSSQVGCAIGCPFCATGALGLGRNLTLAEIIGQLWWAIRLLSPDRTNRDHVVTNVVFMGMGEPLLNYDNVIAATQVMVDDNGYGLSKYRVTVSTCGVLPNLQRLKLESPVSIAISLHATNDELRNRLVPINRKYPIKELLAVCDDYFTDQRRQVTIEYIMLAGVNDALADARALVKLLSHGRYKVNLIPGNATGTGKFSPSPSVVIDRFRQVLLDAGINTITRKSRGQDIQAACGQLAGSRQAGLLTPVITSPPSVA